MYTYISLSLSLYIYIYIYIYIPRPSYPANGCHMWQNRLLLPVIRQKPAFARYPTKSVFCQIIRQNCGR